MYPSKRIYIGTDAAITVCLRHDRDAEPNRSKPYYDHQLARNGVIARGDSAAFERRRGTAVDLDLDLGDMIGAREGAIGIARAAFKDAISYAMDRVRIGQVAADGWMSPPAAGPWCR